MTRALPKKLTSFFNPDKNSNPSTNSAMIRKILQLISSVKLSDSHGTHVLLSLQTQCLKRCEAGVPPSGCGPVQLGCGKNCVFVSEFGLAKPAALGSTNGAFVRFAAVIFFLGMGRL